MKQIWGKNQMIDVHYISFYFSVYLKNLMYFNKCLMNEIKPSDLIIYILIKDTSIYILIIFIFNDT